MAKQCWLQKESAKRKKQDQDGIARLGAKWNQASKAYDDAYEEMKKHHNILMGLRLFGLPHRAVKWLKTAQEEGRYFITYMHDETKLSFRLDLEKIVIFIATYDSTTRSARAFFTHNRGTVRLDSNEADDLKFEPDGVRRGLKRFFSQCEVRAYGKLADDICKDLSDDLERSHLWHSMNLVLDRYCLAVALGARTLWQFLNVWKNRDALLHWIESFNPLISPLS